MRRTYLNSSDRIAALATAPGPGALAVIRTAGPGCVEALAGHFSRPRRLLKVPGHQALVGFFMSADGQRLDEVMLLVFRAPASYTGQDGVDIMCHGGTAVTGAIMEALRTSGFAPALPGEFTFRAFLNGKLDLARAEAVQDLVCSETELARRNALDTLAGGLSFRIQDFKDRLVRMAAACALRLDYGEDESPEEFGEELPELLALRDACLGLAASYSVGRLVRQGGRVILAGRTNAGKSSLFNLLLKEERAIVSDQHGTTRDYVEAALDLDGLSVSLIDTAGLRESADSVEAEGIRRTRLLIEASDLVLYVVDAVGGLHAEDQDWLSRNTRPVLPIWNKIDSGDIQPLPLPLADGSSWLACSACTAQGEHELAKAIKQRLLQDAAGDPSDQRSQSHTEPLITSERQRDALRRAAAALDDAVGLIQAADVSLDMLAVDLAAALAALGEISGETSSEDILDSLFSNFCVGK